MQLVCCLRTKLSRQTQFVLLNDRLIGETAHRIERIDCSFPAGRIKRNEQRRNMRAAATLTRQEENALLNSSSNCCVSSRISIFSREAKDERKAMKQRNRRIIYHTNGWLLVLPASFTHSHRAKLKNISAVTMANAQRFIVKSVRAVVVNSDSLLCPAPLLS